MFEILNNKDNNASGYYFYANPLYLKYGIYAYKPEWDTKPLFNFIIKRWRGPVVGIRTYGARSNWLSFWETNDGYVRAYGHPVLDANSLPSMAETYTLEAGMCKMISNA